MKVPLPAGASVVPQLYDRGICELLQARIPEETEATCMDCAMCGTKDKLRTELDTLFHEKTKCCTYFPSIPNFLAGKILLDEDPSFAAGRARFQAHMLTFTVATPLGVSAPPAESARYGALTKGFGQDTDLRCPYYFENGGGLCGIWKYRDAKCTTWFCKHIRGQAGRNFWRAVFELLHALEGKLSVWCIHQLHAGSELFRELFPLSSVDLETFQKQQSFFYHYSHLPNVRNRSTAAQAMLQTWGDWVSNERCFFEECSRLVDRLAWKEVVTIGGPKVESHAAFVKEAYLFLMGDSIPICLKKGSFKSVRISAEQVRVWGYSQYDPIDIPRRIFDVLMRFDGSPWRNTVTRIKNETGLEISDMWIHKLCDFKILIVSGS